MKKLIQEVEPETRSEKVNQGRRGWPETSVFKYPSLKKARHPLNVPFNRINSISGPFTKE